MFCTKCGMKIPDNENCPNCSPEEIHEGSQSNELTNSEPAPTFAPAPAPESAPAPAPTFAPAPEPEPQPEPETASRKPGGIIFCLTKIDRNFMYLFAAVFVILASFIPNSLYLALTGGPVPGIISIISNIILFLGFCALMVTYSIKDSGTSNGAFLKKIVNMLINTAFIWVLLMALYSLFGYVYYALSGTLTEAIANKNPLALLILAGFVVLLLLLEIGIITTATLYYILQRRGTGILGAGRLFFKALGSMIARPILTIVLCAFLTISLILGKEVFIVINSSIGAFIPYSFLSTLIGCLFAALLNAYILFVFFNTGRTIIAKNPSILNLQEKKGAPIPIFAIIVLVPVIVTLFMFNTTTPDSYISFKNEVQNQINQADILFESGLEMQSSDEYIMAYSKILAVRGYFTEIMTKQNTASTISGRADFAKAASLDPSNSLLPLFSGNILYMSKSYTSALSTYKEGMKNPKSHPDLFMSGYMAAKKSNDKQTNDFLHWLINNDVYTNTWMSFTDYNVNTLEGYINELKELEIQVEPKLANKYYSYVFKGEHNKAASSLEELKRKYPANPEISYYLSMVYSEMRSENSLYASSVLNASDFLKSSQSDGNVENDKQKELYVASVYSMANQNDKAEAIYKKWYIKDNKDYETAEKYIYALTENKKYDDALAVIATIEGSGRKSANLVNYHAVALLNKGMFEDSLKEIVKIKDYESNHDETYDRILYSYSLTASMAIKTEENLKQLETIKDSILYNYINALYKWRLKDSVASNVYLAKVLEKDSKLGYAWYCSGINYYEKAVREKTEDYKNAIESYQKSVAIVPDHVETYFALGHCLKKAGLLKEALNAFRKTVDLLPYEDHRTDPYGMTVHAAGVINELNAAIAKEAK